MGLYLFKPCGTIHMQTNQQLSEVSVMARKFMYSKNGEGMTMVLEIDPLDKHQGINEHELVNTTGLLLGWANDYAKAKPEGVTLKEYMLGFMPCAYLEHFGGTVEDGVYKSPYKEDKDLYPFVTVNVGVQWFSVYPYSIVHFNDNFITRMD